MVVDQGFSQDEKVTCPNPDFWGSARARRAASKVFRRARADAKPGV